MKDYILLKNASVIDKDGEIHKGLNILISYGKIESITDSGEVFAVEEIINQPDSRCEEIDCSEYYVTPGLTNLHSHTAMNFFKGIAEDVDADSWFNKCIFPYESKLTEDDVYVGTKLGIAEMINAGVTAFSDHYFNEKAVLKAVLEMGIRCDISPTIFGMAPNFGERLEEVSRFLSDNKGKSELVSIRLGPHAPYTCPPETLRTIVKRSEELDCGLHMHISETREQVSESMERHGKTPYEMTYESGAFERDMIIAHGLWITEEDFKFINDKTWFGLCSKTYGKLAMGTGLVFKNRDRINYSFGTDGAASSNTLNPVEQARFFGILGKFDAFDPEVFTVNEIWKALFNGHGAYSFGTGVLEAGAPADLVIWNLNKPNTFPVYHPTTSIIYSSDPSNVEYTMVAGNFLKKEGRLTCDLNALLKEGRDTQKRILERGKGEAKVFY